MIARMDGYRRRVLDDELDVVQGELPAIAIEGAKAVGKTETALQRVSTVRRLDMSGPRAAIAADPSRVTTYPPVLIDEWQHVPETWDVVRRAVDEGAAPGSFFLTGSASPAGTGTHSGAGRIVRLRMRPMALSERLPEWVPRLSLGQMLSGEGAPIEGESPVGLDFYVEELLRSGFPGIRDRGDRAILYQLRGYIERVIDRDFPELGRSVRRPDALRRWMTAYAASTATTASFEKIRDAATGGHGDKPARTDAIPYRDVLERLFVIDPLPAWQPSRGSIRQLGQAPKHHMADPALAATLLGLNRAALEDGEMLGPLFESLVTLSVRVYAQRADATTSHLRTHRGLHEVDLIVERPNGRVIAIEVKLAADVSGDDFPHLTWLAGHLGDRLVDRLVITTGSHAYRRRDGIAVIPAALLGP